MSWPKCPPEMQYLVDWAEDLYARSGIGMGAIAPVSHREIDAWRRLMDIGYLDPLEVEALRILDAAFFDPGEGNDDQVTLNEPKKKTKVLPWPKRKDQA